MEKRIVILEEEVELLKKRPVATAQGSNIDYDLIPSKKDVNSLLERMF